VLYSDPYAVKHQLQLDVGPDGGILIAEFAGLGTVGLWIGFFFGPTSAAALLAKMAFQAAQQRY